MSWKHFFSLVGIKDDQAVTRDASLKALLDYSLLPRLNSREANERLVSMSPSQWVELDEQLRRWYEGPFRQWPETALAEMLGEDVPESLRQPLLFVAGAHSDGRVRQRAMGELPRFPGRLTLAISLIRCADWVSEVRFAAQDAATRLMSLCPVNDVASCWDLVIRLEARSRTSQEWLRDCIRAWLDPQLSHLRLEQLLISMNRKVRAWAYKYAFENLPETSDALLDAAVADPNAAIALCALRHIQSHKDISRSLALIQKGLIAPHPAVRRESLHALSNREPGPSRELLHRLLCDSSGGVRSLAGYLLRQRFSEDPREHWRHVLIKGDSKALLGAMASLCDLAAEVDVPLFRRWLQHPSGHVRANALRGLLKTGSSLSDEELTGLMDTSTARIRQLLGDAVLRGGLTIPPFRVVRILSTPGCTPMRLQLLWQLVGKLGHWQHLSLLLQLPKDDASEAWYQNGINHWLDKAHRYAPLGASTRANLLNLLAQRRGDVGEAAYATIMVSLERH